MFDDLINDFKRPNKALRSIKMEEFKVIYFKDKIKISIEKPLLWLQVISDIAKNNQLNFSRLRYPDNLVRIN